MKHPSGTASAATAEDSFDLTIILRGLNCFSLEITNVEVDYPFVSTSKSDDWLAKYDDDMLEVRMVLQLVEVEWLVCASDLPVLR